MSKNQISEPITTTTTQQQQEEQDEVKQQSRKHLPDCKQDFPQPQFEELAFQNNWVIWEKYQKGDYSDTLCEIAAFNDVISFWQVWNQLPHSQLKNLFYDSEKSMQKVFKVDGVEKQIDAVAVFKQGIKPEWEDSRNNGGTLINWKLPESLSMTQATKQWLKLNLLIISESQLLPEACKINGIRVVDKKKNIKFQVWCEIDKQNEPQKVEKLKKGFEGSFKIKQMNSYKIKGN